MPVVTAMTWGDDDREVPAREVTGELTVREVSADWQQCLVDGVLVNPDTIRPVEDDEPEPAAKATTFDESKVKRDHGKFSSKPGDAGGNDKDPGEHTPGDSSGGGATTATETGPEGVPPPSQHELDSLSHLVPKAERSAWPKIASAFEAVRAALFVKLSELSVTAGDLAPEVLDTAEDYSSMKASPFADHDAWHDATGISWTFTQVLVKHAIGAGFAAAKYAKGESVGKAGGMDDDRTDEIVALTVAALEALYQALGIDHQVDADAVRELVLARGDKR